MYSLLVMMLVVTTDAHCKWMSAKARPIRVIISVAYTCPVSEFVTISTPIIRQSITSLNQPYIYTLDPYTTIIASLDNCNCATISIRRLCSTSVITYEMPQNNSLERIAISLGVSYAILDNVTRVSDYYVWTLSSPELCVGRSARNLDYDQMIILGIIVLGVLFAHWRGLLAI